MTFSDLQLHPLILKAIAGQGYAAPTPIQAEAIPAILAGRDLLASARTGTGKTAAFMLPALQRLTVRREGRRLPRVLVLTPTRELADQIDAAARRYGRHLRFNTSLLLGGMPYRPQLRQLAGPLDLVVATPGRLLDHLEQGRLDLSHIELLVLDEADRMLDMGFVDDVEKIAAATPAKRQTLLFSATLDKRIAHLSRRLLQDPLSIAIETAPESKAAIDQRVHLADNLAHKGRLLEHLVNDATLTKAIIFSATKRHADGLADSLRAQGHEAAALHGDMNQAARNRTMAQMRSGKIRLLVATDVAARGIDLQDLSHVINFDLPRSAEDYVHRIGRTGRAGRTGTAISLALPEDGLQLARIERFTGQPLAFVEIPGLEPTRRLRQSAAPRNSGRGRPNPDGRGRPRSGGAGPKGRPNGSTARFRPGRQSA
ncbi:MAG: DEAD/DEAH box helicase [Pseudomonadota bacterium]|nr:DEAD/DEAH box helicase [Pseudomonadota bacterium]